MLRTLEGGIVKGVLVYIVIGVGIGAIAEIAGIVVVQ